ncbi:hypothetical protein HMN09_01317900 [Mycena chlorophos]|uniref:Enoyl reductase (ER) domain-containing protein n=1 Tax=Mycena chlorophos TaxID=658473 RepID=A0A8H6VQ38_MYCCL|nr:hypothetical protein HMN09_01317900 [Mycena chlorophos]
MSDDIDYTVFKGSADGTVVQATTTRAPPAAKEVLLRITHSGICGTDEHYVHTDMALGHEGIGVVEQIGSGVSKVSVGDIVGWGYTHKTCGTCESCLRGHDQYCINKEEYGSHNFHQGSYGTHAIWSEDFLFKIPAGLDLETAATLMCAGATIFGIIESYNVRPTDRVAVAGMGGLGHLAIQFLAKMGCATVVFSATDAKREEAMRLGATEFVVTAGVEKFEGVEPVDHFIITTSAALNLRPYLSVLKPEAKIYPTTVTDEDIPVPIMPLIARGISIQGTAIANRAVYTRMLDFAKRNNIRAIVERFPMTLGGSNDYANLLHAYEGQLAKSKRLQEEFDTLKDTYDTFNDSVASRFEKVRQREADVNQKEERLGEREQQLKNADKEKTQLQSALKTSLNDAATTKRALQESQSAGGDLQAKLVQVDQNLKRAVEEIAELKTRRDEAAQREQASSREMARLKGEVDAKQTESAIQQIGNRALLVAEARDKLEKRNGDLAQQLEQEQSATTQLSQSLKTQRSIAAKAESSTNAARLQLRKYRIQAQHLQQTGAARESELVATTSQLAATQVEMERRLADKEEEHKAAELITKTRFQNERDNNATLKQQLATSETVTKEAKASLDAAQSDLQKFRAEAVQLKARMAQEKRQYTRRVSELEERVSELSRDWDVRETELGQLKARIEEREALLDQERAEKTTLQQELDSTRATAATTKEQLDSAENAARKDRSRAAASALLLREVTAERDAQRAKLQTCEKDLEDAKQELEDEREHNVATLNAAREELDEHEAQKQELAERVEDLEEQIAEARAKNVQEEDTNAELREELETTKVELGIQTTACRDSRLDVMKYRSRAKKFNAERDTKIQELAEVANEKAELALAVSEAQDREAELRADKTRLEELLRRPEQRDARVQQLEQELSKMRSELADAQAALKAQTAREAKANKAAATADKLSRELGNDASEISRLARENSELRSRLIAAPASTSAAQTAGQIVEAVNRDVAAQLNPLWEYIAGLEFQSGRAESADEIVAKVPLVKQLLQQARITKLCNEMKTYPNPVGRPLAAEIVAIQAKSTALNLLNRTSWMEFRPNQRSFLYPIQRTLVCGGDSAHMLVFNPTEWYDDQQKWVENIALLIKWQKNKRFDLFVNTGPDGSEVRYAGIYQVVRFRQEDDEDEDDEDEDDEAAGPGIEQSEIPSWIPIPAIVNALGCRVSLEVVQKHFSDPSKIRVECFGLKCVGFDHELYAELRRRWIAGGGSGSGKPQAQAQTMESAAAPVTPGPKSRPRTTDPRRPRPTTDGAASATAAPPRLKRKRSDVLREDGEDDDSAREGMPKKMPFPPFASVSRKKVN